MPGETGIIRISGGSKPPPYGLILRETVNGRMSFLRSDLPKRKHPRLRNYDYSMPGAYFITICTHNKRCLLSNIEKQICVPDEISADTGDAVGRGLAPAENRYTLYGEIAEKQLFLLEKRYPCLKIDRYVIMPNHIHVIIVLGEAAGASPRPTIMEAVCAFKSLTTRECKKVNKIDKLFQTSFYEHVIRGDDDYNEIAEYIRNNPKQWELDRLYSEE